MRPIMSPRRVAVVVGNPKPRSRTYQAAHLVAERLAGRPADLSIDLADLGAALAAGLAQSSDLG